MSVVGLLVHHRDGGVALGFVFNEAQLFEVRCVLAWARDPHVDPIFHDSLPPPKSVVVGLAVLPPRRKTHASAATL
jgi:hypothetical protein